MNKNTKNVLLVLLVLWLSSFVFAAVIWFCSMFVNCWSFCSLQDFLPDWCLVCGCLLCVVFYNMVGVSICSCLCFLYVALQIWWFDVLLLLVSLIARSVSFVILLLFVCVTVVAVLCVCLVCCFVNALNGWSNAQLGFCFHALPMSICHGM